MIPDWRSLLVFAACSPTLPGSLPRHPTCLSRPVGGSRASQAALAATTLRKWLQPFIPTIGSADITVRNSDAQWLLLSDNIVTYLINQSINQLIFLFKGQCAAKLTKNLSHET